MDERYKTRRQEIEKFFAEANCIVGDIETTTSPTGKYELVVRSYNTRDGCWNYTRGTVKRLSDGLVVADVKRNYSHFWHCWHLHQNSCEYLLCGEDYQGYTVVNLTAQRTHIHFPEAGYDGVGFCWVDAYPSPDSSILAIDGCYWACPYEIVFFDFSTPDQLPYREIARVGPLDGVKGWKDEKTFVLTVEQEIRKSDGRLYDDLSEEEQAELDENTDLVDYVIKKIECRPQQLAQNGATKAAR